MMTTNSYPLVSVSLTVSAVGFFCFRGYPLTEVPKFVILLLYSPTRALPKPYYDG